VSHAPIAVDGNLDPGSRIVNADCIRLEHSGNGSQIPRRLFMVLAPRSLSYARIAIESLFRNALEPFSLALITDSADDKETLLNECRTLKSGSVSKGNISIFDEDDLSARESETYARYPNIARFRHGHPCWRKITDPILLSGDGEEIIILDPDLYFPNKFRFEETPQSELLLMWQRPSCLLPAGIVHNAMSAGIPLAHHTDIGVAQWKMPIDLFWLDWLLGKLGAPDLPRNMHVESIVWAGLAMRLGGGYLNPDSWLCWRRTQFKRILRKLGMSGPEILRGEPWADIKCFHAGGEAKWWLSEAKTKGYLDLNGVQDRASAVLPFVELKPDMFARIERRRAWLKRVGYYSLFPHG
jgi:hypothetical protein